MIRPGAARTLSRGAEALIGLGALALGAWWTLNSYGALRLVGVALLIGGAGLAYTGWRLWRVRRMGGGPGLVRVTEGRIAYAGPLSGGVVARDGLDSVALDGLSRPACWRLTSADGTVSIPLTAEGADALPDLLVSLPGIDSGRLMRLAAAPPPRVVPLWSAGAAPAALPD
ncbi:MAG: hypothetical protein ACU0BF_03940 [Paracoccaceae bacterium]